MTSAAAISRLDWPSATSASTDSRVAYVRARLRDQLDHRRVQRVRRIGGRGAAFDVVHPRALVGDDQGPLELPHILRVDAEVGLQRHLDVCVLGHINEAAAGPDRGVERGELVVCGGYYRAEVLPDQVRVLPQAGVHVEEDDALLFEVLANGVVDDFGLVLRRDACEKFPFCLRDAEFVERLLDIRWYVVPVLLGAVSVGRR